MRWYGALQEGPTGTYTIMVTDFENGISGGLVADDQPEHVAQFLGFIDHLIANGDEITLVTDRYQRLFRFTDRPTLWRTLVEKYAPRYYTLSRHSDGLYYEIGPDNGNAYFESPVCIALVRPGSFLAMHGYLTGSPDNPDTVECARAGCRAATSPAVLLLLRANTHVPSSKDVFHTMVEGTGPDFSAFTGGPDMWATVRSANTVADPDVAEFHLQYAETLARFRHIDGGIAQILAVLISCQRYRLGLEVSGPSTARSSSTGAKKAPGMLPVPLPLELPDVPEDLMRAYLG